MNQVQNICLVDDDDVFHFITKKIIERTDLVKNIKVFYNGREAIHFLESSLSLMEALPDVILLDLNMPIMDGWEFLEEFISLKPRLGKKISIYIVSSSNDPADVMKAKSISEVTDFVIKPVTEAKFVEMIQGLLSGSDKD